MEPSLVARYLLAKPETMAVLQVISCSGSASYSLLQPPSKKVKV